MNTIVFLCVNYNNADYTIKFCDSLAAQLDLGASFLIDCVIIDNSTDVEDSAIVVAHARDRPWITYLKTSSNLGYFGGLNFGLASRKYTDANYVVISNNDLEFDHSFCKTILTKTYDAKILSVCPDVVTKDGFHQNPHSLRRIGWFRRFQFDLYFSHYYVAWAMTFALRFFRQGRKSPVRPELGRELYMGIGACYILTPAFLTQFSQLNYPNFLYGEEAYFSDQIHAVGGVLWFDPELVVHHAESATTAKIPRIAAYNFSRDGYPSYRRML